MAGSSWWAMAGLDVTRFPPHIVALAVAYALAIPIGWDRERSERSAGLRTFPLVAIAACGFVQATERLIVDNPQALARVVEGIIGGVGFIGGGAILKGETSVHGTATAASLWATGAVGRPSRRDRLYLDTVHSDKGLERAGATATCTFCVCH